MPKRAATHLQSPSRPKESEVWRTGQALLLPSILDLVLALPFPQQRPADSKPISRRPTVPGGRIRHRRSVGSAVALPLSQLHRDQRLSRHFPEYGSPSNRSVLRSEKAERLETSSSTFRLSFSGCDSRAVRVGLVFANGSQPASVHFAKPCYASHFRIFSATAVGVNPSFSAITPAGAL